MLSARGGLPVSGGAADIAGGHKPCLGDTGAEADEASKKHGPLTPFHVLPVTEGFIFHGVLAAMAKPGESAPTFQPCPPPYTGSPGACSTGEQRPHRALLSPKRWALKKHRPSPPANSGAAVTARWLFQPRSPATGTTQKAQKVPSVNHHHLRNKHRGKLEEGKTGAACSEQVWRLQHGADHHPPQGSVSVHSPLQTTLLPAPTRNPSFNPSINSPLSQSDFSTTRRRVFYFSQRCKTKPRKELFLTIMKSPPRRRDVGPARRHLSLHGLAPGRLPPPRCRTGAAGPPVRPISSQADKAAVSRGLRDTTLAGADREERGPSLVASWGSREASAL